MVGNKLKLLHPKDYVMQTQNEVRVYGAGAFDPELGYAPGNQDIATLTLSDDFTIVRTAELGPLGKDAVALRRIRHLLTDLVDNAEARVADLYTEEDLQLIRKIAYGD